jgi:hypothetical protein
VLHKQLQRHTPRGRHILDFLKNAPPKGRNRVMVGMLIGRQSSSGIVQLHKKSKYDNIIKYLA